MDLVILNATPLSILHGFSIWWLCLIDLKVVHRTSTQICEMLIINELLIRLIRENWKMATGSDIGK